LKAVGLASAFAGLLIVAVGTASSAATSSTPALTAFTKAWATVTAYNATITAFEQKGIAVQNVIFKYTFRKPTTVTVDVVGGPNNGVSILWTGGTTVSAHRSGLASAFKETLSLHDPKITTIRGSSIDRLSFSQILAHAQTTAGKFSQGPGPLINGVATDAVTLVPKNPAADAGYTREIIEISRLTHLPLRIVGYQGPTLVRVVDFVAVTLTR
jgi:outer membrane lipoprotein-sorting protein